MFYIIILGLLLRLTNIVKPEGLWNDEYVSWYVSSFPLFKGFWQEVVKQCHMPLYYLYIKPFANCSDTVLRLTSVLPGVIAIPVMYLAGKEYSKKAGYFAAIITSVLSFLVYYSQEVRFYSLLFLFSALSLLFTIKYLKKNDWQSLAGYIISNILILSTHIIGAVYVFLSLLYVVIKKKKFSVVLILMFITIIAFLKLPVNFLRMMPASQWWGNFSYTNILFLFSDYFSPILTNNVNAPPVFFYNKSLALWLTVPTLIALAGMAAGIRRGLALVAAGTVLALSVAASMGILVFITKYSIEILPILILFVALGFDRMKRSGIILLSLFVICHLGAYFTPHYVTKLKRYEGHKIVGDILNKQNSQNILFTYYEPDRFYRYANVDNKKLLYISKSNRHIYKDNPAEILSEIPAGESVSVVFLDSVSFFDDKFISANKNNPKIPEMFLTFSEVKNSLIKRLDKDFTDYEVSRGGYWTVIRAVRKI